MELDNYYSVRILVDYLEGEKSSSDTHHIKKVIFSFIKKTAKSCFKFYILTNFETKAMSKLLCLVQKIVEILYFRHFV